MSYFLGAGLIGLGIIAYKRRKALGYKLLNVYTDLEEIIIKKTKNKNKNNDNPIITYFYMKNNDINETSDILDLDSELDYFIKKINYSEKIYHILSNNILEEVDTKFDKEYFNKYNIIESHILACTFNLSKNDTIILKEYDISKFIDSFLFGKETLNINDNTNCIMLNYIKKYYKLDIDLNDLDKLKFEYIILDKNVDMHKGNNLSLVMKNNNLSMKFN